MEKKAKERRRHQLWEALGKGPKPGVAGVQGNDYPVWFWASKQESQDEQPKSKEDTVVSEKPASQQTPEDDLNQLLVDNAKVSASTFYNILKSNGYKIQREAEQTTANIAVTRAVANGTGKKKYDYRKIQLPDAVKKSASTLEANATITIVAKHKRLMRESAVRTLGNMNLNCKFSESSSGDNLANPLSATKFDGCLIKEGLGNFKDGYYYTKEAIKSAVPAFEGKKMYADHPSSLDEEIRPERSVRDIVGHFQNVQYKEDKDGLGFLEAEIVLLPDEPFQWVRALMRHAVEFSKQFPDKDFVGLSINASGDADPMSAEDFIKQDLPDAVLPKIQEAIDQGLSEIKVVKSITDAVSCDLVTEAGARGKVLKMLEAEMKNKEDMESKEAAMEKKEADDAKKADDAASKDSSSDDADAGADDGSDDDKAVMKKMLKKHLGDEAADDEGAHKAAKHYMAAYEAMGYKGEEAMEKACEAMKCAKHAHESMESEAKEAADKKDDADADDKKESVASDKKMESELLRVKGENAKLKETIAKRDLNDHIENKLKESKLPMAVTKKFKETCKSFKSIKEFDEKFALFTEGYRAISGGEANEDIGYGDSFVISTEKEIVQSTETTSFSDCLI